MFKGDQVIFCYHNVSPTPSEFEAKYDLCHSPDVFNKQLIFLSNHFEWLHPEELGSGKGGALLTFDDGYRDSILVGGKLLEQHRAFAVFFLNMAPILRREAFLVSAADSERQDFLETRPTDDLGQRLVLMKTLNIDFISKEELVSIELKKKGRFFWGNHFYNHYNAPALTSQELVEQYRENEIELKKFESSLNFFAYPFGQRKVCYSQETNDLISKLGARFIFAAHPFPQAGGKLKYRYSLGINSMRNTDIRYDLIRQKLLGYFYKYKSWREGDESNI